MSTTLSILYHDHGNLTVENMTKALKVISKEFNKHNWKLDKVGNKFLIFLPRKDYLLQPATLPLLAGIFRLALGCVDGEGMKNIKYICF